VKQYNDLKINGRCAPVALLLTLAACSHAPPVTFAAQAPQNCELSDPFSLARVAPTIPQAAISNTEVERTTIVGTIADAETGLGVHDAIVHLTPIDAPKTAMIVARSDSTGAFVVRDLAPDRYLRQVVATFFTQVHDTVAIAGVVDTMRLVIHHGPAFCVRELNEVVFPKKPTVR
jgi:hypothetical protein